MGSTGAPIWETRLESVKTAGATLGRKPLGRPISIEGMTDETPGAVPLIGHTSTVAERREYLRRIRNRGIGMSVFVHLLLFVIFGLSWTVIPESPFAAAGPRAGDDQAAAGGMQSVNLSPPRPRVIQPPPVPLATLEDIEPVELDLEPDVTPGDLIGSAPGELEGPGLENGTGQGDGGTAEEGLFRLVPPTPRGMIMPPTNSALRGKTVEVWVFVNTEGRVVADSTRLNPPTNDRSFNERLIAEASEWIFRPATQGGKPIASWFPYSISM